MKKNVQITLENVYILPIPNCDTRITAPTKTYNVSVVLNEQQQNAEIRDGISNELISESVLKDSQYWEFEVGSERISHYSPIYTEDSCEILAKEVVTSLIKSELKSSFYEKFSLKRIQNMFWQSRLNSLLSLRKDVLTNPVEVLKPVFDESKDVDAVIDRLATASVVVDMFNKQLADYHAVLLFLNTIKDDESDTPYLDHAKEAVSSLLFSSSSLISQNKSFSTIEKSILELKSEIARLSFLEPKQEDFQ